jgi:hypothetical protein
VVSGGGCCVGVPVARYRFHAVRAPITQPNPADSHRTSDEPPDEMQREADEQQGADQLGKKASHTWHPTTGIRRKWSKCLGQVWLMMGCSGLE